MGSREKRDYSCETVKGAKRVTVNILRVVRVFA
jgi:hypothetical protein